MILKSDKTKTQIVIASSQNKNTLCILMFLYTIYTKVLWHGNKCGKKKTKVMRISRQPTPVTIKIDQNNWRM